jgi:hypothetical protein
MRARILTGRNLMTKGISGVLAAGVVVAALAAPASAETRPTSSPDAIVVAQASPDGSTATRPSRKRAETRSKKEPTAGQMVARERQKKCAAEWKTAKAGGKVESGMKWPKFWSACNARLKGNSA